jgi:hypothetical protein
MDAKTVIGHFNITVTDTGLAFLRNINHASSSSTIRSTAHKKAKGGTGLGLAPSPSRSRRCTRPRLGGLDAGQRLDVSDAASHARRISQVCPRRRGVVSITLRNCPKKLNRLAAARVAGQSRVTRDGHVATIVECATRGWPLREMAGMAYGCPLARAGSGHCGNCGNCGSGERSGH